MKQAIVALCASAALMGAAEVAGAHDTSKATTVEFIDTQHQPPGTFRAYGDLLTTKKCRVDRRVKIFFDYVVTGRGPSPEWTLVDVDTSSRNGMWAGSGDLNLTTGGVDAVKIRATRKNVGKRGHRHICRPDTEIVPLA
jgi:hypothetical protein